MRVDSEIPKPRPMMGKFQSYKQLFRNQVRDGMKGAPTQGQLNNELKRRFDQFDCDEI